MAQKQSNRRGFATRGIHAGQAPDPTTGAIMMPIYATSTYVQSSPGVHKGYEYSRTQNPTRMAYDCSSSSIRVPMSSPPTISMAGHTACSAACASARQGSPPIMSICATAPRSRRRSGRRRA